MLRQIKYFPRKRPGLIDSSYPKTLQKPFYEKISLLDFEIKMKTNILLFSHYIIDLQKKISCGRFKY